MIQAAFELCVEDENWRILDVEPLVAGALDAALAELGPAKSGALSILLAGDAELAALNEHHRGKTGPTNVLAFPAHEAAAGELGDLALSWQTLVREAAERGVAPADHARHLLIHGFLHLQGYDHANDEEAEVMETLERRALARLGVADPYAGEESRS